MMFVDSVIKWLQHQDCDQHVLNLIPTHTILLCPWERHSMAFSPAWWSWQAVINFSHIFIKFHADSNILASPEAGQAIMEALIDRVSNCLPYLLVPPLFSCESGGQI